jgi:hypothetical protein
VLAGPVEKAALFDGPAVVAEAFEGASVRSATGAKGLVAAPVVWTDPANETAVPNEEPKKLAPAPGGSVVTG